MTEAEPATKKILIVDDEPDVVTYMETLLQDNAYDTASAADGQAALDKLRSERPDLVCLDISMPEKSGVRFYREVKDDPELAKIPIVVVTGVTGFGLDPEGFKKFISSRKQVPPPEGFVPKPIDREALLATIKQLLS